jgi:hypothetical protein
MEEKLSFPSKIDWWLPVLLAVVLLSAPVSLALGAKHSPFTPATLVILVASFVLPVGLLGWMFADTTYVIDGDVLRVHCGPMRVVVPLESITRIERGSSLRSGLTLSLSRLCIRYGRFKEVLISPKDAQGFIRAIVARVPGVVLEDLDEYR